MAFKALTKYLRALKYSISSQSFLEADLCVDTTLLSLNREKTP